MAGSAGGRAQVASYHHGIVVHTLLVIGELVGLDAVGLHVLGIGMTTRARGGDVDRMHFRARIGRGAHVMHTVAIGAHRDLSVTLGPLLFFFNDTATTEIYTLSLHDALPI